MPTPGLDSGPGVQNDLTAVAADSAAGAWSSGYELDQHDGDLFTPYVLHDTGAGWALTRVPTLGEEGSSLTGISATSPASVWAVGQTFTLDGSTLAPPISHGTAGWLIDSPLTSVAATRHTVLAAGGQEQLGTPGPEDAVSAPAAR